MEKKVKFNGMDVFIILVVLAVIAAGVYFLFGRSSGGAAVTEKNTEVTAVLEICGMEKEYTEKIKVGDIAMLGEKDKMETVVKKIEVNPAKTSGYDILDGRVIMAEIPDQYDVQITVSALGTENDSAIKISGTAIKVGQLQVVNAKGWAGSGYVIGLETADVQ